MSTGINVLRYSALALGVFYGFSHQATITSASKTAAINHEYQKKLDLIAQAKAEFTKRTLPSSAKNAAGNVITDPEDPNFDLEAWATLAQAGQV